MSQFRQSILQDNCGNAVLVEPLRDGIALAISDVADVSTARTKDDGSAIGLVGRRKEYLKF